MLNSVVIFLTDRVGHWPTNHGVRPQKEKPFQLLSGVRTMLLTQSFISSVSQYFTPPAKNFRVVSKIIPRLHDFRGISVKGFDKRGNFNFSFKELVFPEIDLDDIDSNVSGLNVTIVTSTQSDAQSYELLRAFSFPFRGAVKGSNLEAEA